MKFAYRVVADNFSDKAGLVKSMAERLRFYF